MDDHTVVQGPRGMLGRATITLAVALVGAASGCTGRAAGGSGRPGGAAVPGAAGPPVPAGGNAAGRRAVVAAYDRFWAVTTTVDSQPPGRWRALLAAVAADPVLSQLLAGFAAQVGAGQLQYGTVRPRPVVVALSPDRASILDCQDASGYGLTDGSGLPGSSGSARTPAAATLVRDRHGVWRVAQARYLPGTC